MDFNSVADRLVLDVYLDMRGVMECGLWSDAGEIAWDISRAEIDRATWTFVWEKTTNINLLVQAACQLGSMPI